MQAATLNTMTKQTDPPRPKNPGRAIAARRTYLGLSQFDLEDATNGKLSQTYISKVETGKRSIQKMPIDRVRQFLDVLRWNPQDWEENTGVELPSTTITVPSSREEPYDPTYPIPQYDTLLGGILADEEEEPNSYYPFDPKLLPGRPMKNMRVAPPDPAAMASEQTRARIPQGTPLIIERGATPTDNQLCIAWSPVHNRAVLIRKNELNDPNVVLSSYEPNGPTFRAGSVKLEVRGVARKMMLEP